MGKIFDLDSPIMRGLSKMADVMWLNILVLIFALPLIIQQYLMLGALVYDDEAKDIIAEAAEQIVNSSLSDNFDAFLRDAERGKQ